MSKFVEVEAGFSVSPQLVASDLEQAAAQGFKLVVNNRPEDEESEQPSGADLADHAKRLGMAWVDIPVTHAGFSANQVERLGAALEQADGPVLAYCRSGTRSTMLWALAQARAGRHPAELQDRAVAVGYDLTGLRPLLDQQYAAAAAS